ncbi:conserved hypothetical protein [Ricinus communis]|uniref:Uncharacterized protein n=1 Tax=Ricinus communis TaxID=3988 RepID=B9TGU6_RICCO|nr:conserved hypothetical protein [Ricinus communis]
MAAPMTGSRAGRTGPAQGRNGWMQSLHGSLPEPGPPISHRRRCHPQRRDCRVQPPQETLDEKPFPDPRPRVRPDGPDDRHGLRADHRADGPGQPDRHAARRSARGQPAAAHRQRRRLRPADRQGNAAAGEGTGPHRQDRSQGQVGRRGHRQGTPPPAEGTGRRQRRHPPRQAQQARRQDQLNPLSGGSIRSSTDVRPMIER